MDAVGNQVVQARRVTLGDLKRFVSMLEGEGITDKTTVILDQDFADMMTTVSIELLDEDGYDESLAMLEGIMGEAE